MQVAPEVGGVVAALEVLVDPDHLVDLGAHVGLEDGGGDLGVVGHTDRLADVVAQGGDDDLGIGARPLGPGRRLDRVLQLIHGEAVGDGLQ